MWAKQTVFLKKKIKNCYQSMENIQDAGIREIGEEMLPATETMF